MPGRSRNDDRERDAGSTPESEGIVYSASGDFYIAEALRSARSSLRHNRVPHVLFSSSSAEGAKDLSIERFEPSENPFADKIANMRRSPFQRTIYLDSDTYVIDEITHVLRVLDHYDLAAAYAPAHRGQADPEVPAAFYEFNTGVLAWRASERIEAFMRDWEETYRKWLEHDPFAVAGKGSRGGRADQPSFRRCAWQHDVKLFVLAPEYNLRLGYPATVVDRVRVIHGRDPDYERLAARINGKQRARVWPPRPTLLETVRTRARRAAGLPRGGPKLRPPARADTRS